MPSSSSFSGSSLSLQSVEAYGPATIRVTYTFAPEASSSSGPNDALNISNYTLTGPIENTILSVSAVPNSSRAFDILLDFPLSNGDYVLAVEDVETADGDALVSPSSMTFTVSGVSPVTPVGLETDGAKEVLEKHFPLRGENWNALMEAVAQSDEAAWETAAQVFDQLFTSSASGEYLVRRASDYGIKKPLNIGLSDEQFRKFAIKTTNGKVTQSAALQLLEVFYGKEALHAHATTTLAAPFALEDGMTLSFLVDERHEIDHVFSEDEFAQIQNANAAEVAASITRAFEKYGVEGYAETFTDPDTGDDFVRVYSAAFGLSSALRITGGSAQNVLKFPEELSVYTSASDVTWTISATGVGEVTFLTTSSNVDLSVVEEGDYVNVFSDVISSTHEGAFDITSVDIRYNGSTKEQRFTIQNDSINAAISATAYTPVPVGDVTFFRPEKLTVQNSGRTVVVSQQGDNELDVVLPATAEIVSRTDTDAAYMQEMTEVEFDTIERLADEIKVTTTDPHSFSVGDNVLIDGFFPSSTAPSITAGDPGETDTSKKTILSTIDSWSSLSYGRYSHTVTAFGENKALIAGGISDVIVPRVTSLDNVDTVAGPEGHELDASTLALWRMEEIGTTILDAVGTYDITSITGTAVYPGRIGKCRKLDGVDDTMYANADSDAITAMTGDCTVEAWVKLDESWAAMGCVFQFIGNGTSELAAENALMGVFITASRAMQVIWEHGAGVDDSMLMNNGYAVPAGTWTHIAVSREFTGGSQSVKMYINGQLKQSFTEADAPTGGTNAKFHIGSVAGANSFFNGYIDEIRISKVARSAAAILDSYQRGMRFYGHRVDANTLTLWKFNEASGTVSYDDTHNANLTWVSAPTVTTGKFEGNCRSISTTSHRAAGFVPAAHLTAMLGNSSVEFWFRSGTLTGATNEIVGCGGLISSNTAAENTLFSVRLTLAGTTQVQSFWETGSGTDVVGTSVRVSRSSNVWTYVCVTREVLDATTFTVKTYINGVLRLTENMTRPTSGTNSVYYVGNTSGSTTNPYEGDIEDVRFSDTVRTASEILANYEEGCYKLGLEYDSYTMQLWQMDELANPRDATGYANINSTSTLTQGNGIVGGSWLFDNSDQIMTDAGENIAPMRTLMLAGNYTVDAWVYPTARTNTLGFNTIWTLQYGAASENSLHNNLGGLAVNSTTGMLRYMWEYSSGTDVVAQQTVGDTVPLNKWTHVAAVVRATGATRAVDFYINGVLQETITGLTAASNGENVERHHIGNWGGYTGGRWIGAMDEIRVQSTPLDAAGVLETYQRGRPAEGHTFDANTVALWRCDEPADVSSATLLDEGGTYNLTPGAGGVTATTNCYIGGARTFAGTGTSYATFSDTTLALRPTFINGNWSFEAWVKPTDLTNGRYIFSYTKGADDSSQSYNYLGSLSMNAVNGLNVFWENGVGANVNVSQSRGVIPVINRWYHVAVTVTTTGATRTVKFYIDGELQDTITGVAAPDGGDSPLMKFMMGSSDDSGTATSNWQGHIDDARLSNVVRTDDEILASYMAGRLIESGAGYVTSDGDDITSIEFSIDSQLNTSDQPPQYAYSWAHEAVMPYGCFYHKTFYLSNPYTGEKLIAIGGSNGINGIGASALYDPYDHTWELGPLYNGVTATAVENGEYYFDGTGLALFDGAKLDNDYIVFAGGTEDFMTTSDLSFMYVPSTNTIISTGNLVHARLDHRITRLDNDFALASGGRAPQGATENYVYVTEGEVLRYAEVFNGSTWSATGSMGIARYNHASVLLPNGEVLVIGGQGYNPTNETVSRILDECELYDPRTGRWRPTGRLAHARQAAVAYVIPGTRKVVVMGGTGTDQTAVVAETEYYDIDTGRWGTCPAEMDMNATDIGIMNNGADMLTNGTILVAGGYNPDDLTDGALDEARLFVRNGDKIAAGDVNGFKQITEVGADWFKLDSEFDAYAGDALGETRIFSVAAADGEWTGPFIYDPEDSAAITATQTTLDLDLAKGRQYKSITVTDTSDFPEEGGYLCFNFGTDDAIYPVKYLGVLSSTELALDYTFKFPADVSEGSKVILLYSKVAFEPDTGDAGGFVATDSSAGRVAASEALEDILAAGMTVNETIKYPGDIGLGNAGEPNKVSDAVAIWAGDDIDDEVEEAREELEDE